MALNFAILDVEQTLTKTGYKIIVTTEIACFLYMYYTTTEPQKHPEARFRRGIQLRDDIRYCFVNWKANLQEEIGHTFIHTFIKEPWPFCETRWFTFRALIWGTWSPSVGPIFKKHRQGPDWALLINEPWQTRIEPPPFQLIIREPWS